MHEISNSFFLYKNNRLYSTRSPSFLIFQLFSTSAKVRNYSLDFLSICDSFTNLFFFKLHENSQAQLSFHFQKCPGKVMKKVESTAIVFSLPILYVCCILRFFFFQIESKISFTASHHLERAC